MENLNLELSKDKMNRIKDVYYTNFNWCVNTDEEIPYMCKDSEVYENKKRFIFLVSFLKYNVDIGYWYDPETFYPFPMWSEFFSYRIY